MKTEDLLKIIKDDETQEIEFKSRCADNTGESICSFANTNNGLIILGILGDGTSTRTRSATRLRSIACAKTGIFAGCSR
jgi:predicted HTH transcriptional regulator